MLTSVVGPIQNVSVCHLTSWMYVDAFLFIAFFPSSSQTKAQCFWCFMKPMSTPTHVTTMETCNAHLCIINRHYIATSEYYSASSSALVVLFWGQAFLFNLMVSHMTHIKIFEALSTHAISCHSGRPFVFQSLANTKDSRRQGEESFLRKSVTRRRAK